MPPKRKYQKKRQYRRRRPYRRRRTYPMLRAMGTPSGMPTTRIANLRYVQKDQLSSTSGVMGSVSYNANSVYAPRSSGGHQPMGFDTWASMYNHYVVLGSRIKVSWSLASSSSTTNDMVCGIMLNDDGVLGYAQYDGVIESRKGGHQMLHIQRGQKNNYANFSAKKFFNLKDVKDNVSRIGAHVSASPTELAKFIVWGQSLDLLTSNVLDYVVQIEYIVLFSEPKELAQS